MTKEEQTDFDFLERATNAWEKENSSLRALEGFPKLKGALYTLPGRNDVDDLSKCDLVGVNLNGTLRSQRLNAKDALDTFAQNLYEWKSHRDNIITPIRTIDTVSYTHLTLPTIYSV